MGGGWSPGTRSRRREEGRASSALSSRSWWWRCPRREMLLIRRLRPLTMRFTPLSCMSCSGDDGGLILDDGVLCGVDGRTGSGETGGWGWERERMWNEGMVLASNTVRFEAGCVVGTDTRRHAGLYTRCPARPVPRMTSARARRGSLAGGDLDARFCEVHRARTQMTVSALEVAQLRTSALAAAAPRPFRLSGHA